VKNSSCFLYDSRAALRGDLYFPPAARRPGLVSLQETEPSGVRACFFLMWPGCFGAASVFATCRSAKSWAERKKKRLPQVDSAPPSTSTGAGARGAACELSFPDVPAGGLDVETEFIPFADSATTNQLCSGSRTDKFVATCQGRQSGQDHEVSLVVAVAHAFPVLARTSFQHTHVGTVRSLGRLAY